MSVERLTNEVKALREQLQASETTVVSLRSQNSHLHALLKQVLGALEVQSQQALSQHLSAKAAWEDFTAQRDILSTSNLAVDSSTFISPSVSIVPPPPPPSSTPDIVPQFSSPDSQSFDSSILSLSPSDRAHSGPVLKPSPALAPSTPPPPLDTALDHLSLTFPSPSDSSTRRKLSLPAPPDSPRDEDIGASENERRSHNRPPPPSLSSTRQRAKPPSAFSLPTRARSQHDLRDFGSLPRQPWTADQQLVKDTEELFFSAQSGKADSQYQLGRCFEIGRGVVKDLALAVQWYRKAAEQGHSYGQNSLAVCLAKGIGVDPDPAQAVYWYRLSADQENGFAMNNLGMCYEHGLGIAKNKLEALALYRRSTSLGNASAQANLDRLLSKHMTFSESARN